jgi:uncharacterized protein YdgA (DUF945 family)
MKKLVVAVLAIIAVALVALPEIYGRLTEAQVKARVASINGGLWSAEIKSYERSWFRSHAVIDLALSPAYAEQLALAGPDATLGNLPLGGRLPIAIEVAHGPVAVLDGVYLGWSKVVARPDHSAPQIAALEQQLGVPQLFEFRSSTSFLGATSFEAEVPKFDLPVETASVHFSGASAAGTVRGNHVKSDGHIDSIEVSSPTGRMALSGLRAEIDSELRSQALMLGTVTAEIDSVSFADESLGSTVFDAAKIKLGSSVTVDASGARLGMNVNYDIASMTVADVKLTDASIGVAFRNVDVAAYQAYQEAAAQVVRSRDPSLLQPAVMRLIASRPTLAVEPIRVLADGELFEARIELTPNERATTDPTAFADPTQLAAAFDGSAQIDISRRLAERIAQQVLRMQLGSNPAITAEQLEATVTAQSGAVLLMLAGQGIIEASGTGYRAKVELANGQLMLNGRPMPLP